MTSVDKSSRSKKNQPGKNDLKRHTKPEGFNLYLQNISSQSSRIYIFASAPGMFSRTDHMLGHKTSPKKFQKIEIISNISDHNGMKLEINYKKETEKYSNI